MDGEEDRSKSKPEETGVGYWKNKTSKNLKQATSHLRAEAIRRYRLNHAGDPTYEPHVPGENCKNIPHTSHLPPVKEKSKEDIDQKVESFSTDRILPPIGMVGNERKSKVKNVHDSQDQEETEPFKSPVVNEVGPDEAILQNNGVNELLPGPVSYTSYLDNLADRPINQISELVVSEGNRKGQGTLISESSNMNENEQSIPMKESVVDIDKIIKKFDKENVNLVSEDEINVILPEKIGGDLVHLNKGLVSSMIASTVDSASVEHDEQSDNVLIVCNRYTIDYSLNPEKKNVTLIDDQNKRGHFQEAEDDIAIGNLNDSLSSDAEEKVKGEKMDNWRQPMVEHLTFDVTKENKKYGEEQKETVEQQLTEEKPSEGDKTEKPDEKTEESTPKEPEQKQEEVTKLEEETTDKTEASKQDEQKPDTEQTETKQEEGTKVADGEKKEEVAQEAGGEKKEETTTEAKPAEGDKKDAEQTEQKSETDKKDSDQAEGEKKGSDQAEGEKKEPEQAEQKTEGEEKKGDGDKEEGGEKVEGKGEEKEGDENKEDGEGDTNQSAKEGVEEEKEEDTSEKIVEKKKDVKAIPDDFYYEYDTFVSKAVVSEGSGLPQDMLKLVHSFGYDCTKRNNLYLLDDHTVCFAAGNLVQLLDLNTKEQRYIRSTSGGGIGAITVHPSQKYFAVGEKGKTPNINIFEYPSLKLYRILRGGTEKSYASLDFSPDGNLLSSQGGDPDFMLTLWEWQQEQTVLRSKAFSQDVFRVTFSADLEGQLTTAGTSHIRFWKMADTFTGLKLQGQLGKFGRTEITDIEGYVELPDGKVLSGAEWGNMLLWEGGLIKVEITRKQKKSCHTGPIQQILLDEGELITVGSDGYIRVWDFESIDTADTTDDSATFEMEPMNELKVGNDVNLRSIIKSTDAENEITVWYAQDANGGIWKLDLSFSHTSSAPEKMFTYHAGSIACCDTSPASHIVASTGADHTVRLFDYVQKKQICEKKYNSKGTAVMWAPKIVDTKSATVIAGFNDGVIRVLAVKQLGDGGLHRRHKNDIELDIIQAFKPHSKAVRSISIDHSGDIMATGGEDSSVFFMSIKGQQYEPIGYVEVPAPVRNIQWSPSKFKKSTLLVFCEDGYVVEIDSPEGNKFDTSHTFHITGLTMRQFRFKSIKSRLRHEEEMERKRIEEAARKKKEEEERRRRIERGLETESEQGDEPEEKKEPEQEWSPYIPETPSPILTGYYSDEGRFWLSMGEFDAGYLYECKFMSETEKASLPEEVHDEPIRHVAVLESDDIPIHNITFSSNGKQVMFGMEDGAIRIHSLDEEFDIATLNFFWQLNIHDNNYGHLTGLKLGYDALSLLTVGGDGNFFMFDVMTQENLDKKIAEAKAKLPSAKKKDDDKIGDDIDDPSAYSIEEAKQKAEYDKMMKLAEEKKREVRRQISKFRRQFKSLLEKNETLPSPIQLKKEEFEMDREIKEELQKQRDDRIEIVKKELAWESEKQRISLEKLRKRYKDVVECERIVVIAFKTNHEVASFRAAKLSDDFYHMKAEFERRKTNMTRDDLTRDPTRELLTGQTRLTDMGQGAGGKADDPAVKVATTTTLKGSMGERISKALGKVEEKKKKRAQRRAQWDELYETKPDDDFEDPNDVSAIKEAKDNMGYFNLKTAKDYIVPDHLRMNVEKARGRLLILKDLIHEYKYNFNLQLLALRDKKIKIIEEIKDVVKKLKEVQEVLAESCRKTVPKVPEMQLCEMPEKKLEYTRETLIKFKKEYEEAQKAAKGSGSGFGGFGGFGGGAATKAPSPVPIRRMSVAPPKSEGSATSEILEDDELTPLEIELKQAEDIKMLYEQDRLLSRIDELVTNFDAELRILRHDKFKLDIVMKNADLRQVTLFEELVLLKEYEKRENLLADKVTGKAQEKIDMQNKIVEVTNKIEMKKKEIEKLGERDRTLQGQFQGLLGEKNQWADYLTKVYKKKIKRAKKKVTEDGDSDDSEESDSDDSDWDEDEDESDDDGGYDLDICPPGCDQTLYDNVCALREKRLDIEEELVEEKKNNDNLKKELESMNKKLKVIINALKTAQNDLEAFQLEKQQKLNELDVVVTLKLHQIQYMINGVLPQELSQTLVFESNGVNRLQQRIKELEHEKQLQKKQMKESRKTHVTLIKDRKIFDAKITEMEDEANEMMTAKFGRIVDLEKLETITVNRAIEELKEKLRMTEIQCSEEINEWDDKIREKKNKITSLIRDNTNRLDQLNLLMNEQKQFEVSLDSRQKNLGEEYSGARKADVHEKQRLIQLVQLQAQEIDALKEEIMLLSRKGGHILPPAQPPLPQTPPNLRTISN